MTSMVAVLLVASDRPMTAIIASPQKQIERPAEVTGRQVAYACAASVFGWGLDLFDLFLLLYVAPIIGNLFFPTGSPMLSLSGAYASFAVTLFVRPWGAALFGSYADRRGRRRALMAAVVGVGLVTAAFGLLPSVADVGWIATVIFLVLRLVQGIFVGGVVASSHTIGTETVGERWRGLMSGSVGGGGSAIGGLLASLVFTGVSLIAPGPAFAAWGWRLMFFSGLLTSVVGYVLFRSLEESPIFRRMQASNALNGKAARSPLRSLVSTENLRGFAVGVGLSFGAGAGYYLTSGYLPTVLKLVNGVPNTSAALVLAGASVAAGLGSCLTGEASQHLGRKRVLVASSAIRIAAFPVLFLALGHSTSIGAVTVCAILLAFVANASYGPLLITLNESFPTALRATGTGLCWNIGFALAGMLPTLVPLAAGTPAGMPTVLATFGVATTLVYLFAVWLTPETRGNLDRR